MPFLLPKSRSDGVPSTFSNDILKHVKNIFEHIDTNRSWTALFLAYYWFLLVWQFTVLSLLLQNGNCSKKCYVLGIQVAERALAAISKRKRNVQMNPLKRAYMLALEGGGEWKMVVVVGGRRWWWWKTTTIKNEHEHLFSGVVVLLLGIK